MGKREVLLVLELENKWLTSNEIAAEIPYCGFVSVSRALKKLVNEKSVKSRPKPKTKHEYQYKVI